MITLGSRQIPVIDLFAGPGGLAEGFSAYACEGSGPAFRIALSIEKDSDAHSTLELRSFLRQFPRGEAPSAYYGFVSGKITRETLFDRFKTEALRAKNEAWRFELGPRGHEDVKTRIKDVVKRGEQWVLIGGPPCQAYSLVGRSRRRGVKGYIPELDKRQTLYVEYLQILADHGPAVFIMENVKGLLSAHLEGNALFSRIRMDLEAPYVALEREGRPSRGKFRYTLHALGISQGSSPECGSDSGFVVHSERFGIPQARHRVIILGVRKGLGLATPRSLEATEGVPSKSVLAGLPQLRSRISGGDDSPDQWMKALQEVRHAPWLSELKSKRRADVAAKIIATVKTLSVPPAGTGGEFLDWTHPKVGYGSDWYLDPKLSGVLNHSTRAHMTSDLHRYLFCACWAQVLGHSPALAAFPKSLLPRHRNVKQALTGSLFSDRFRVQVANQPARTITSHISKDGHSFIHYDPTQCRSLTVREAARLQTFPDNYFFSGGRTSQYVQVGNAVPPLLAALCWFLPAFDEFHRTPGNAGRILSFLRQPHTLQTPLDTLRAVAQSLSAAFCHVLFGVRWQDDFRGFPLRVAAGLAVVQVVGLLAGRARAKARGALLSVRLCELGLVAIAGALWSVAQIRGPIHRYLLLWIVLLGTVNWVAVLNEFGHRKAESPRERDKASSRWLLGSISVAGLLLILIAPEPHRLGQPDTTPLREAVRAFLRNRPGPVRIEAVGSSWPWATAIAPSLFQDGKQPCFDPGGWITDWWTCHEVVTTLRFTTGPPQARTEGARVACQPINPPWEEIPSVCVDLMPSPAFKR